ncbi:MAG: putative transcriptional regulator, arsR family, partial [Micavibrio sp.]|nr:putative transcriptional regulator, arsR family [Micavibrio sp.]
KRPALGGRTVEIHGVRFLFNYCSIKLRYRSIDVKSISLYIKIMKILVHPAMDDVTLEAVLYALGDKTRLQIVANLDRTTKDTLICVEATAGIEDLSSSTSSYHFRILRDGGIIHSERQGKECYNRLRLAELEKKFPGVLKSILKNLE